MNSYFKTLADLLPPHQQGRPRNKVDILIHASDFIKDLTNQTEQLFHAHAVDAQSKINFKFYHIILQQTCW